MAAIFENASGRAGVTCAHAQMTRSTPKGYYSRLFPKPAAPIEKSQEAGLIELGHSMLYGKEREGTLTPRVGFTYFGQFLGHDLTHDVTPLEGPYPNPEDTPNYRTPSFDLDHVYGGGPDKSPHLYEGEPGAETFRIGATTPTGYPRDLPVEHATVLIGDQQDRRNLDNLILRQLHVAFLKFHNEAIKQVCPSQPWRVSMSWDREHCSNGPRDSCAGITSGLSGTIFCPAFCTRAFGTTRSEGSSDVPSRGRATRFR